MYTLWSKVVGGERLLSGFRVGCSTRAFLRFRPYGGLIAERQPGRNRSCNSGVHEGGFSMDVVLANRFD